MITESEFLTAVTYGIIVCPAHQTDGSVIPEQLHKSYDEFALCVAAFMIAHISSRGIIALKDGGHNPENPLIVWNDLIKKLRIHQKTALMQRAMKHFGLHLCSNHLELVRLMDSKIMDICRFLIGQLLSEADQSSSIRTTCVEERDQAV